jgi:acetyl-CoA carboxylase biotin carboxyl carrier protein
MSDRQPEPTNKPADAAPMSAETASLLGLIDRLGSLLERSDLVELEVESGEIGIILRKPAALQAHSLVAAAGAASAGPAPAGSTEAAPAPTSTTRFVKAPLTGVYYGASSPGSPPFLTVGQQVAVGQVIGLIEAMKLFNEIKSDQAGRVVRLVAESGKLVKAKSPLIEVEP